ncbi:hypothetical protein OF83DRAFT_600289 [Amylostereum chailletii]|nr:hypothetical protein OF83DRAFT_600289 [Amylostereum chailletii]
MDVLLAAFHRIRLEDGRNADIVPSPHIKVRIPNFCNVAAGSKTRLNLSVLVSRLPPEVLTKIISIVAVLDPPFAPQGKHKGSLGWIQTTHVCRYWRDVILGDPVPWARVVCTFLSLDVATEMLERAGDVPLVLKVAHPASATALQEFALNLVQRASRIVWTIDEQNGGINALARWMRALSEINLPDLENLEFKYTGEVPEDAFLSSMPSLRATRLRHVVLKGIYIPFRPSTALTELSLDTASMVWTSDRGRQFFSLLGQAPNLEILHLRGEAVPSAVPRSTRPRVALPKLKQLLLAHADGQRCVQFWRALSASPSEYMLLETDLATRESLDLVFDTLHPRLARVHAIRGLRLLGRSDRADITFFEDAFVVPLHLDVPNPHLLSAAPQDHWFTHGVRLKLGYTGDGRSESVLVNVLLAMYRKLDLSRLEVVHLETAKELNVLEYANVLAPMKNLVGLSVGDVGTPNLYAALQPPTSSIPVPVAAATPRARQAVLLPRLKWMIPGASVLHRSRADANLPILGLLAARAIHGCALKTLRLRADAVSFMPVMEKEAAVGEVKRKFPDMKLEVVEVVGIGKRHR